MLLMNFESESCPWAIAGCFAANEDQQTLILNSYFLSSWYVGAAKHFFYFVFVVF